MSRFACVALLVFAVSMFLVGCAGGKPAVGVSPDAKNASQTTLSEPVRDSLRAKFVLTLAAEEGKMQDFDAVLFSVPGKRYRMELTGPMGIGVASLLWQEDGWQMVFPTEKQFVKGNGEMVGLLNAPGLPTVPIHQIANLFEGILLPEKYERVSEKDSAGVKVVCAKSGDQTFTFSEKDGNVTWFTRIDKKGFLETLKFSDFRTFEDVLTPERISYERDGKFILSIRIKKVTRKKAFSSGTWRLNIPKSYKPVGG